MPHELESQPAGSFLAVQTLRQVGDALLEGCTGFQLPSQHVDLRAGFVQLLVQPLIVLLQSLLLLLGCLCSTGWCVAQWQGPGGNGTACHNSMPVCSNWACTSASKDTAVVLQVGAWILIQGLSRQKLSDMGFHRLSFGRAARHQTEAACAAEQVPEHAHLQLSFRRLQAPQQAGAGLVLQLGRSLRAACFSKLCLHHRYWASRHRPLCFPSRAHRAESEVVIPSPACILTLFDLKQVPRRLKDVPGSAPAGLATPPAAPAQPPPAAAELCGQHVRPPPVLAEQLPVVQHQGLSLETCCHPCKHPGVKTSQWSCCACADSLQAATEGQSPGGPHDK